MKQKGVRKIDEVVGEDGMKYPIKLDMETGIFSVSIRKENEYGAAATFQGSLEEVRTEAVKWLKENSTLKFEPVIVIHGPAYCMASWNPVMSEDKVDLNYKRYFRATRSDGTSLWKSWSHVSEDDIAGTPDRMISAPNTVTKGIMVLPYSPERWSALRLISAMIAQLNAKIHGLFQSGKFDEALHSIAEKGMYALLPPEKKE